MNLNGSDNAGLLAVKIISNKDMIDNIVRI